MWSPWCAAARAAPIVEYSLGTCRVPADALATRSRPTTADPIVRDASLIIFPLPSDQRARHGCRLDQGMILMEAACTSPARTSAWLRRQRLHNVHIERDLEDPGLAVNGHKATKAGILLRENRTGSSLHRGEHLRESLAQDEL